MSNKKISQLTNSLTKATVDSADLLPVVDTSASETKKMTYQELIQPTDANFRIAGSADNTKLVAFEVDGLTTATTRTVTIPDATTTMVGTDTTQTLSNKTLTAPQVNMGSDATGDMYYRNGSATTTRLPIGTSGQILQTSAGGIPEWTANPAAADASTTIKGVVEVATDAEVNAGTATGATGATLVIPASSAGAVAANKIVQFTAATKYPAADGSLITNIEIPEATTRHIVNSSMTDTSIYYAFQSFPTVINDGGTLEFGNFTTSGYVPTEISHGGATIYLGGTGALSCELPDTTTSYQANLRFSEIGSNPLYFKYRVFVRASGTNAVCAFGISDSTTSIYNAYTSTANDTIRFVYNHATTTMYAVTSKSGVGYTATNITAYGTAGKYNTWGISVTSTSVLFYVNGVLAATHTTNIPVTAVPALSGWGGTQTSGSAEMSIAPAVISLPNAA